MSFDKLIAVLAPNFADKQHTLFLGRGNFYPIAMEAPLKLKRFYLYMQKPLPSVN